MKRKLLVAGCSFSDFAQVPKVYGQHLSELLDYEYVHEGAGCGSNHRIWRVVTSHILNGNITPNDLIIIQYTEKTRREFWTKHLQYWDDKFLDKNRVPTVPVKHSSPIIDSYPDGGQLIRYKVGAEHFTTVSEITNFFNLYENNFVSQEYDLECFRNNNFMFQKMLSSMNMNVVLVNSYRYNLESKYILPEFADKVFREPVGFPELKQYSLAPDDMGHMSAEGHKVFAGWLFDHLNTKNILKKDQ